MRRVILGGGSAADNLSFTLGCEGSTTAAFASCIRRLKYAFTISASLHRVLNTGAHLKFASKVEDLASVFIVVAGVVPDVAHLVFE